MQRNKTDKTKGYGIRWKIKRKYQRKTTPHLGYL